MKKIVLLLICCVLAISCLEGNKTSETPSSREMLPDHDANRELTTAQAIAYANGAAHWKNVNEIRFTFNVDRGEKHFERTWYWYPKTDEVISFATAYEKDRIQYNRSKMDSASIKIDRGFINDKFWLLAPLNLLWDEGTTFSEKQNVLAPISKDTLNMLTVVYDNDGGYTPGDAYDLYYGKDYEIKEWVFRVGNDSLPTMTTTWEDYETFNGVKIAKTHRDGTPNFKLYFTDISIK
jgi:hypothetical protein